MADQFASNRITVQNQEFEVRRYFDNDTGRPWDESCGHGPVREINSRDEKRPGEVIMTSGCRNAYMWAYDWQAATVLAARDGWGLADEEKAALAAKLKRTPTKKEIRAEAVRRDFEFLNGWVRDDWHYIGVSVLPLDDEGEPDESTEYQYALWRVESNGGYWKEVAQELADEIISVQTEKAAKEAAENAEIAYWASRDVETAGA